MLRLSPSAIDALVARARGVDAMVGKSAKIIAASLVAFGTLGAPTIGSAQGYGYVNDDHPSVVVECGPGQRAVMEQRRINGRTQVVARCEGAQGRDVVYDEYGRAIQTRPVAYETYRPVAQRSTVQYVERAPRRSKTKSALMIAGSAATGAGIGGALKGKKGALIGAAIGGGSASIYEAAKRR
jgi:hypothetical protein